MGGSWCISRTQADFGNQDIDTALAGDPALFAVWGELDDMWHLFGHNFAGQADDYYSYSDGPVGKHLRNGNVREASMLGTSSRFDGATNTVRLTVDDLGYYVEQARAILHALDVAWP